MPLVVYIWNRNSDVDLHERVLTPSHHPPPAVPGGSWRGSRSSPPKARPLTKKGLRFIFDRSGGDPKQNQSNLIAARQSPGFLMPRNWSPNSCDQRADKCMLDYTQDAVAMRFQIDGVWHESEGQDRETGDAMLTVFKQLANLNVEERRKRMTGRFAAEYEGKKYGAMLISQGTQTGERVILQLDRPHSEFNSLRELGMREKMEQQLRELVAARRAWFCSLRHRREA